jgi:hypothetical protein
MATRSSDFDQKSLPHLITFGGKEAIIWADDATVDAVFLNLPALTVDPPKLISVTIAARRCKRYPGDPGYTIPETTVKRLNRVNPKRNAALPGRAFQAITNLGVDFTPDPGQRVYNLRIQGAWATLDGYFKGKVGANVILYSPSGHPYYYAPTALTQGQPAEVGVYG